MNFLKKYKIIISLSLVLVAIIGVAVYQSSARQTSLIVTPTPTVTPRVIPTLNLVPANPNQKLIINWNNLTIAPPEKLAFYTITAPLIDDQTITTTATMLGFRETDAKTTLQETSRLYVRGNRSLFASTSQNQIQFTTSGPLPTKVGFANAGSLEQQAIGYLSQFFKNASFTKTGSPEYFLGSPDDYYPQIVAREKANLIRFNFQQTIAGYSLLTEAPKNAIVVFTYDSSQVLRSLEISGGFQQTEAESVTALLDSDSLRQVASRLALPVSLDATTDTTALINSQAVVTLDLENISLVYFSALNDNQILPVFLLKGSLKGDFPNTPTTYLVPAAEL